MAIPLTSEMHAVLKEHVNASDRIAYYSQLKEWGYKYADLALGVVRADTLSGRTANEFFLEQASDEGASILKNGLAQISLELMQRDFAARSVGSGELSVDTIQDYHEDVFALRGVSSNGWTPDFALRSIDTLAEREVFWDNLLNASNPFSATGILIGPTSGDTSSEAIAWREELVTSGAAAAFGDSNSYGPYTVGSPNGLVIGDGVSSSLLTGGSGDDVIMGFIGADILIGGEGNDRLHGGGGFDQFDGGEGNDMIWGGKQNDIVYGSIGSDTLNGDGLFEIYEDDTDALTDLLP